GFNGTPAAFRMAYLGRETISGPARTTWPAKPIAPPEMLGAPYVPSSSGLLSPAPRAPAPGWIAPSPPAPADDGLPQSTIRPEYRNTGRPLI
ncbi:MAG: cell wall hydrolase, partial [bacterium]|nr:cell wall hydrolase [bacterium]